jgi:tripartite-type tricarboxylate transporter receptor subunit TctC
MRNPVRRHVLLAGLALAAASAAFAQAGPSKPVNLMVPYPAGGP